MPLYILFILLGGIFAAPSLLMDTTERTSEQAIAAYQRVATPDGDAIEVSILALKNARYRRGRPLPKWIQELDGKRIELWGYMAIGTLEGRKAFELVPESCECGRSRVNHFIDITLTKDQTKFIPGRITLTGIFHAGEELTDGFITSLYRMQVEKLPK
ncbi:MAG: hypothetical protein ACJAZN_003171 [Planctomycetota bacterium]|jgi:hypothetical protein